MPEKSQPKKTRGMPVVLPTWWLREAQRKAVGISLSELAEQLSRVARRSPPWDRATVGKFLKDKFPTFEMMIAFCDLFDLPPPHFVARSYEEAAHLTREAKKYDDDKLSAEVRRRRDVLNAARDHLEDSMSDQTGRLTSTDEAGDVGRRRPRGMVRGRSASS